MPYDKVKGHSECGADKIAVVSPSGKVVGCHTTEEEADKQIAALMAKEKSSRWVDRYSASKLLAGEPVLLLPVMPGGYHRWGTEADPITPETVAALDRNFLLRQDIAGLTGSVPLNIEHDELAGKIGKIVGLEVGDEGLYAYFELTARGQEILEDDRFDYLSPEIIWSFQDIQSGQDVGPVLVGAAVTNYPFFGEKTSMYSEAAAEDLVERFSLSQQEDADEEEPQMDLVLRAADMVQRLGLSLSDIEHWGDHPALALSRLAYALDKPEHVQFHYTLALCVVQQEPDGWYPRSAYLWEFARGPVGEWEHRIKGYSGHKLALDGRLVRQVHKALGKQDTGAVERHSDLFEMYRSSGQEDLTMPQEGDDGQRVSVEEFTAMRDRAEAMSGQIDTLTAGLAQRDQQLADLRHERTLERYSRQAERFSSVGVEIDEYAAHFAWLEGADPEGEHLAWFQSVIETADKALVQSGAFSDRGTGEQAPAADPFSRIQQLMEAKAKERGVTLQVGTQAYNDLMTEVMRENPEIFANYRQGLISGTSEPPPDAD